MPNIFEELVATKIGGIPVIALFGFLIFAFIVILAMKKNKKEHKRINLEKAVRKDFDSLYSIFHEPVKKKIVQGFNKIGYAIGQFPMYWDSTTNLKAQIKKMAQGKNKSYLTKVLEKETKEGKNIKELIVIKYCGRNILDKALAKFGKYTYMLIPSDMITNESKEVRLNSMISKDSFLNIIYFSNTGKQVVENIAYKISRTEELTEIADFIPKQNYLEKETASKTIRAREQAEIEKEKYKGQTESV